jgi:hypothetical protein
LLFFNASIDRNEPIAVEANPSIINQLFSDKEKNQSLSLLWELIAIY